VAGVLIDAGLILGAFGLVIIDYGRRIMSGL
jgi:hypothetical protein